MASKTNTRVYDIGFFSSADRGLDVLLDMIPTIEEKLGRKVTTVWAYGWDIYDQFHAKNPEKMKWKWNVIRKMADVGMESKGRLSHEELNQLMQDTDVWAYPTSFTEIFCITALKAQAAGCRVITSGLAALQETVLIDEPEIVDIQNNPKELAKFIDRVVATLKTERNEEDLKQIADQVLQENSWQATALAWDKVLK